MVNRTRDVELAPEARVAATRWTRLRGLLGRPRLEAGEGLVIEPSRGIHTWGMGYPIDVVLTADDGRVVALYRELEPWRRTRVHGDAARAVELPAGTLEATGTRPTDRIEVASAAAAEAAGGGADAADGRHDGRDAVLDGARPRRGDPA